MRLGKMPGKVVTKTYFINENHSLPVLSITSNAANLYGFDFGILQNAIKDREVPATLEYFEPGTGRARISGWGGLTGVWYFDLQFAATPDFCAFQGKIWR
jgi:hypothetical protein